jgi:hypothetical protein
MKYLMVKDGNPVKIVTEEELKQFFVSSEGSQVSYRVYQLGAEVTVDITIKPAPSYRRPQEYTSVSGREILTRGLSGDFHEIDELGRQ